MYLRELTKCHSKGLIFQLKKSECDSNWNCPCWSTTHAMGSQVLIDVIDYANILSPYVLLWYTAHKTTVKPRGRESLEADHAVFNQSVCNYSGDIFTFSEVQKTSHAKRHSLLFHWNQWAPGICQLLRRNLLWPLWFPIVKSGSLSPIQWKQVNFLGHSMKGNFLEPLLWNLRWRLLHALYFLGNN